MAGAGAGAAATGASPADSSAEVLKHVAPEQGALAANPPRAHNLLLWPKSPRPHLEVEGTELIVTCSQSLVAVTLDTQCSWQCIPIHLYCSHTLPPFRMRTVSPVLLRGARSLSAHRQSKVHSPMLQAPSFLDSQASNLFVPLFMLTATTGKHAR